VSVRGKNAYGVGKPNLGNWQFFAGIPLLPAFERAAYGVA